MTKELWLTIMIPDEEQFTKVVKELFQDEEDEEIRNAFLAFFRKKS